MNVTVERDAPGPRFTYEDFVANIVNGPYSTRGWSRIRSCLPPRRDYGRPRGAPRLWTIDWLGLAFAFKLRVPDGEGYFGYTKDDGSPTGARWSWPWNFNRLYYEARKARHPSLFA